MYVKTIEMLLMIITLSFINKKITGLRIATITKNERTLFNTDTHCAGALQLTLIP